MGMSCGSWAPPLRLENTDFHLVCRGGGGKEEGIHADRGQGLDGEDIFPLLVELLDGGSHVLSTHFHSRSSNTLPFI